MICNSTDSYNTKKKKCKPKVPQHRAWSKEQKRQEKSARHKIPAAQEQPGCPRGGLWRVPTRVDQSPRSLPPSFYSPRSSPKGQRSARTVMPFDNGCSRLEAWGRLRREKKCWDLEESTLGAPRLREVKQRNGEPTHAQFPKKPRLQKSNRGFDETRTKVNRYTPGMVQMSFFIIFHWPVLLIILAVHKALPVRIVHLRLVSPEVVTGPTGFLSEEDAANVSLSLHNPLVVLPRPHELMMVAGSPFSPSPLSA